jgi:hypothetical protein
MEHMFRQHFIVKFISSGCCRKELGTRVAVFVINQRKEEENNRVDYLILLLDKKTMKKYEKDEVEKFFSFLPCGGGEERAVEDGGEEKG